MDGVPAEMPRALRMHTERRLLEVEWEGGVAAHLPHRVLRERCPCAQCRQMRRDGSFGSISEKIEITAIEPYGPNAVHLTFSDGHARGIFPFSYLRELHDEFTTQQPGAAGT
jgi:DUF971 family protein